jgi:proteic killer suppression protein
VIKTFKSKETEKIWNRIVSKKLPTGIQNIARRKLRMLNNASILSDLKVPPNKQLKGNRKGQYSIRINDQWRICFNWEDNDSYNVEIVDYH